MACIIMKKMEDVMICETHLCRICGKEEGESFISKHINAHKERISFM